VIKMMWIEKETCSKYYKCGCGFMVTINTKPYSHLSERPKACPACKASENLKLIITSRTVLVHKQGIFGRKTDRKILKEEEVVISMFSDH
jgi:hypothetical protein